MRLSAWLPLALISALAVSAATRPRYGGTLRVEVRATDAAPLRSLVFETLVRIDEAGAPQPRLAVSWKHDSAAKHWQFPLRPGVRLQDGSALSAAAVAAALEPALPGFTISATGDAIAIRTNHPAPDLLLALAHSGWLATGPFRPAALEPGHRATFTANDDYWGGRPFVDGIDVQLARSPRDQLADLELGKADVVEVGPAICAAPRITGRWFGVRRRLA